MATGKSGYVDFAGTGGFTVRIHWSEIYDIVSNSSIPSITGVQAKSTNWYGVAYYPNGTISIDGNVVVTMNSKLPTHELWITAQNAFCDLTGSPATPWSSGSIKHDDDGSKAVSISVNLAWYTISGNYGSGWTVSGSNAISLTEIPRKSSLSAGSGTLGAEQILTVTQKLSSYTHTITYKCGSASGTICTKSSATSISWTPPIGLAAQNTTGTSVTVTLSIETFNGSTSLGSESVTITCAVPASVVPTVSLAVSDAKGYLATYGSYIQNKSQAAVTASGEGVYGSTIKSYIIVCGSLSGTGTNLTFNLPASGKITIKVTATDSRGRSASASTTIDVTAYGAPAAEITSRYRCDADGNEDYLGTYAIAVFNAAVTSLSGKNSASYALKYRVRGTTKWTSIAMDDLTGNYAPAAVSQIFPAGIDSSYDVCIAVTDNFGTIESAYRTVQIAKTLMDFDRANWAAAFGQRAVDANTVAFGLYAKFNAGTSLMTESTDYPGCYYRVIDGVTEWLNPPMVLGVEYATTEKYNGSTVYAKIFNAGSLPNASTKSVYPGITNGKELISCSCCFGLTSGNARPNLMPVESPDSGNKSEVMQAGLIITTIKCTGDESVHTAYLLFKYTKTS